MARDMDDSKLIQLLTGRLPSLITIDDCKERERQDKLEVVQKGKQITDKWSTEHVALFLEGMELAVHNCTSFCTDNTHLCPKQTFSPAMITNLFL